MAENLGTFILGCIDELSKLQNLLELLKLIQSENGSPDEKTQARIDILIDAYWGKADYHYSEIRWRLQRMQAMAKRLREISAPSEPPDSDLN